MVPKSSYDIVILGTRREKSKVAKIQVDFVLSYQEEKGLNGLSVFSHIKKRIISYFHFLTSSILSSK